MTWKLDPQGWYVHPTLGGITRIDRDWYWRPQLPERGSPPWTTKGPYPTLRAAKAAAESEKR